MHVLAVNSVSTLLNFLSEQLANTPSLAEIQGWNKEEEETEDAGSKAPDEDAKVHTSLFINIQILDYHDME